MQCFNNNCNTKKALLLFLDYSQQTSFVQQRLGEQGVWRGSYKDDPSPHEAEA